jgi:hypothetical protein
MVGDFDMDDNNRTYDQLILSGCGIATLVAVMVLVGLLFLIAGNDRRDAQYPGSIPISSHSNYRGLPFEYRWDDAYKTKDNFTTVYNWYSVKYNLGAEVGGIGKCIVLDGTGDQWIAQRHINVSLYNGPAGQMIYLTRFTTFSGRSAVLGRVRELQSLFTVN